MSQQAVIYGLAGTEITAWERAFFRDADPWGYILFARNIASRDQVRRLTAELRSLAGRDALAILIDQEGGRVQRLKSPISPEAPPASHFGKLEAMSPGMGEVAAFENARAIALDLAELGLTVDCLPVLDLPQSDADPIIGDRAYGTTPDAVIPLARRSVEGLIAGGVLPVIKHLPGHGRALQDSHLALPRVGASLPELEAHDFRPFQAFSDMPLGMTAHIVYDAIDPDRPLTLSPAGIASTIRGPAPSGLQFDGLLMTDDLSMKALDGPFERRASEALAAGCDVVLHCNGEPDEMLAVAKGVTVLSGTAAKRARRVDRWIETLAGPLASDPRGVADQLLAALDAPRGAG